MNLRPTNDYIIIIIIIIIIITIITIIIIIIIKFRHHAFSRMCA